MPPRPPTATPQHFTVASPAGAERPTRKFPARKKRQRRTAPGPDPPGSSRCPLRRRNRRFLAYSSPSRSPDPPHLTVLTRPGFVRAACHHPRHLPDQAALSFDRLAATRRRRRSLTSTRSTSASRRTLSCGHRLPQASVRAVRDGGEDPAGAYPRRDRSPGRRVDRPAGPQPDHGPQRQDRLLPLPDPGPWRQVHQHFRRDLRQRECDDGQEPAAGSAGELLCREMGTHGTSGVHRPNAHLQRTPPAVRPGPVRRPLQRAPPAPVPPATTTRPRRPGQLPVGPAGSAAQGARRRDQRVPPAA